MAETVRLKDIIDGMEMQLDESSSYLNRDTGKVETVSHNLLSKAEELDEDEEPQLSKWEKEEWEIAKQIVSTDRFKMLPTKYEIHEWSIMQNFAYSVKSDRIRDDLLHALHGAGAYRYFKDTVRRHRIEQAWFAFREEAMKQIAIDWCEENQIDWE